MLAFLPYEILLIVDKFLGDSWESFVDRVRFQMTCKSMMRSIFHILCSSYFMNELCLGEEFVERMCSYVVKNQRLHDAEYDLDTQALVFSSLRHRHRQRLDAIGFTMIYYDDASQKYSATLRSFTYTGEMVIRATRLETIKWILQNPSAQVRVREVYKRHSHSDCIGLREQQAATTVAKISFVDSALRAIADSSFLQCVRLYHVLPTPHFALNLETLIIEWPFVEMNKLLAFDWSRLCLKTKLKTMKVELRTKKDVHTYYKIQAADQLRIALNCACPGLVFTLTKDWVGSSSLCFILEFDIEGTIHDKIREQVIEQIKQEQLIQEQEQERLKKLQTGFKIRILKEPLKEPSKKSTRLRQLLPENRECTSCGALYRAQTVEVHKFQSQQRGCHLGILPCSSVHQV